MKRIVLPIVVLVVVVLIVIALFSRPPKPQTPPGRSMESEIVSLERPVLYCAAKPLRMPRGKVQILVDGSGSMTGVRSPVLRYVRWVEQAISRLRDSAIGIDEFRIAQFDRRRGILPSATVAGFMSEFQPRGQTNLHDAIRSSAQYELTFIVTDGIAAAGAGSGDCAAGVDAACVARALQEAIHVEATTSDEPNPGIWMVPLWTRHHGPFYTEKAVPVASFDVPENLQRLHSELNEDISIQNPRMDSEQNLMFDYSGPRGILIIVIAHSADVGRQAIASLQERAAESDIAMIDSVQATERETTAMPPIEIYPGYLPPVVWADLVESDESPARGTIDTEFLNHRQISLDCPRSSMNSADFSLSSRPVRATARCTAIYQLPAFELGFVEKDSRDGRSLASFLTNYKRTSNSDGDRFTLHLQCGDQEERPCSSNPLRAQWLAQTRYDQSGGKGQEGSGAQHLIASLSTTDPVAQPHRIFGLASLLSIFYDEVSRDQRQIVLSEIEFCHRSAATK
ncbi:MAG: hypothetical protein ABI779_24500 [Acidobacteriota bacterium]